MPEIPALFYGDPEDDEAHEYNLWRAAEERRRQDDLDGYLASSHRACGTGWV